MLTATPDSDRSLASLADVLNYQNQNVVDRFLKKYEVSRPEAEELFTETKKFLWLAATKSNVQSVHIEPSMIMIDEMWHNFVLFTKDYMEFCEKYFSRYLHHRPVAESEKVGMREEYEENTEVYVQARQKKLFDLVALVHDHLGSDTATLWFRDLPERYGAKRLSKIQRPPS